MTRIAWPTRRASTGKIVRWTRVHRTRDGKTTVCGQPIPRFAKLVTLREEEIDPRIRGGTCSTCNAEFSKSSHGRHHPAPLHRL